MKDIEELKKYEAELASKVSEVEEESGRSLEEANSLRETRINEAKGKARVKALKIVEDAGSRAGKESESIAAEADKLLETLRESYGKNVEKAYAAVLKELGV
ncbi:MAG: hypothetical protein ABIH11_09280 [Candidatus Altiarchaeota archaeon]